MIARRSETHDGRIRRLPAAVAERAQLVILERWLSMTLAEREHAVAAFDAALASEHAAALLERATRDV